jgi:hypothetical protein
MAMSHQVYHGSQISETLSPASKVELLDDIAYLFKAMGIYMINSGRIGNHQKGGSLE